MGHRGLWANRDGDLVWGDEKVLEMAVVMLHDHVNVLNSLALKHLQTVKMENFILRVFYRNFYFKKIKKKKKGNSQEPVTFAVPTWLCRHWTERGRGLPGTGGG